MVIDASVWISALVEEDVNFHHSTEWLESKMESLPVIIVPTLALVEIAGAVSRRDGSADRGRRALMRLLNVPQVQVVGLSSELAERAAHLAADLKLRGADAVYVAVAERLDVPLVTWDRELLERAATAITVHKP